MDGVKVLFLQNVNLVSKCLFTKVKFTQWKYCTYVALKCDIICVLLIEISNITTKLHFLCYRKSLKGNNRNHLIFILSSALKVRITLNIFFSDFCPRFLPEDSISNTSCVRNMTHSALDVIAFALWLRQTVITKYFIIYKIHSLHHESTKKWGVKSLPQNQFSSPALSCSHQYLLSS